MSDSDFHIPVNGQSRRQFLFNMLITAGSTTAATSLLSACGSSPTIDGPVAGTPGAVMSSRLKDVGPLMAADINGLMMPAGFTSRVVAVSGEVPVLGGTYIWHNFPDGGATYATPDGGWVYTSNSEVPGLPQGGCGAIKFATNGDIVDAYSILQNTTQNCAGGKSTWNTWLSCEETVNGQVFDCDPLLAGNGIAKPALGLYAHEAVAVDPFNKVLYLTEDNGSGRFYRFLPTAADWPAGVAKPNLEQGRLQALKFVRGQRGQTLDDAGLAVDGIHAVTWEDVAQPDQPQSTVRTNLGDANAPGSRFRGGEGLWYLNGIVFFSTKSDNRIWALDVERQSLEVIYDFATSSNPILSGVDNLTVTEAGDVLVAEDGGDMQINVILPDRSVIPLIQASDLTAQSEITGPAFSPDGTRLYFSAQRSGRNGSGGFGITFEVTLPFTVCPSGACP